MESQTWNTSYTTDSQINGQLAGNTPGKSPYYVELEHATSNSTQSQHTTPHLNNNSNYSTPGDQSSMKRNTPGPNQMGTPLHFQSTTPSNFTESEQLFLQELEENMYEHQLVQQQIRSQSRLGGHDQGQQGPLPGNFRLDAIATHQPMDNQMNFDQEAQEASFHRHNSTHPGHQHTVSNMSTPNGGVPVLHSSVPPQPQSQLQLQQHHHPHQSQQPPPPPQHQFEFGLDNLNFMIPEELNFDTEPGHVSSAFPPKVPTEQTPSLLAINAMKKEEQRRNAEFSSPILPGQNEKLYNKHHLYHRQNSLGKVYSVNHDDSDQHPQPQHVRPDAVFTPLVSPAVTPLDKGANGPSFNQKQQQQQQQHHHHQSPANINFEPLTSPALNAQQSSDKRRKSSSVYAPSSEDHRYQNKRRTPHGTPVLAASNKSYISPSAKAKSSTPSATDQLEKLPQSSIPESKVNTNDTEMLPPSGKPREINEPPLMGFTMGRLAEVEEKNQPKGKKQQQQQQQQQPKKSKSVSRKSSISKSSSSGDSSASSSPKLTKKPEKLSTKKASHKIAEQGRRNRMNTAIADLASLIPQLYHDEISIPSKATTVELASRYIRKLLGDIENLKSDAEQGVNGAEEEIRGNGELVMEGEVSD